MDGQLGDLGGQRLLPCGQGDEDTGKMDQQFGAWSDDLLRALRNGPSEGAAAQAEIDNRSDGCTTLSRALLCGQKEGLSAGAPGLDI